MTNLMTKFINFWLRFSYKCILTNHHLIETVYRLRKFCDLSLFKGFLNWTSAAAAAAKSLQSCPTLCDPIEGTPPGFPIPGILQARTLEWVAISFSNAGKWKVKVKLLSRVQLFATPWTAAHQAPPSMGFSRQEYWSGVPLSSPVWTLYPIFYFHVKLKKKKDYCLSTYKDNNL